VRRYKLEVPIVTTIREGEVCRRVHCYQHDWKGKRKETGIEGKKETKSFRG